MQCGGLPSLATPFALLAFCACGVATSSGTTLGANSAAVVAREPPVEASHPDAFAISATSRLTPDFTLTEAYRVSYVPLPHGTHVHVLVARGGGMPPFVSYRAFEDGSPDFPAGSEDRQLTDDEWSELKRQVDRAGFWRGVRFEDEPGVLDGIVVELEGKDGTNYRATTGFNPLPGPLVDLARALKLLAAPKT